MAVNRNTDTSYQGDIWPFIPRQDTRCPPFNTAPCMKKQRFLWRSGDGVPADRRIL
jgi:hypothetical protein